MENLKNFIQNIKSKKFDLSLTAKGEQIQQTQRNALKAELIDKIFQDLKEKFEYCYLSSEGILLEIENDCVADNIRNDEGSGAITIAIDLKVKDLKTNAPIMSEIYESEQREKKEKEKAKEKAKQKKILADTKTRKEKREQEEKNKS